MSKQQSRPKNTFRYRRRTYEIIRVLALNRQYFWVVQQWGYGEWGFRYKAFDQSNSRWVSIRERSSSVKAEQVIMQIARKCDYNIPHIYFRARDGRQVYLVQEWLDGYDLRYYIGKGRAGNPYFDSVKTYYLIRGLISGLKRFHEYSAFHGDLKPENLIVTPGNRLAMIDFGAAWTGAQTHIRPSEMTARYAAPEQWSGHDLVDHRADQFAVSVILYEMLTSELPYEGAGGIIKDLAQYPPLTLPSRKNMNVWPALDRVIAKGLSVDKSDRYGTTAAWLNDFEAASPPENYVITLRRFWRRVCSLFAPSRLK